MSFAIVNLAMLVQSAMLAMTIIMEILKNPAALAKNVIATTIST